MCERMDHPHGALSSRLANAQRVTGLHKFTVPFAILKPT